MADDQLSRAFTALADPTRRDIVARLSLGDATPGQLAEPFAMSLQAVSKHLKVLEEAGLISRSREAQRRPCHLETAVLEEMTAWVDRYRRNAEERFRRLDAVLATMGVEVEAPTQPHRAAKTDRPVQKRRTQQKDQAAQADPHEEHTEGVALP